MEIYRLKANQTVSLPVPDNSLLYTAKVSSEAFPDPTPTTGQVVGDNLVLPIPFKHTMYDGKVSISLDFTIEGEPFSITREVTVVTPLFLYADLDESELKSLNNPSADDVADLERFIRHIIEAYTGQSFGYSWKTYRSENPRNVTFNAPLLEFIGVSERYATYSITVPGGIPYEVLDDGFAISLDWNLYHAKSDTFFPSRAYRPPTVFYVEGKFGYVTVPEDVRQAALVLLGLFRCDQSLWRDRYIESLRNADGSSVKYNEGAYVGTGSVAADQLLLKYVRAGISSADVV